MLAVSFASPGIARALGIDRAALDGAVHGMMGMGFGSILLGGVADGSGRRRRTLLGCLTVMALGMIMAAGGPQGIAACALWRVFTGFGIGGMLASINAVAAEFSNATTSQPERVIDGDRLSDRAMIGGSIAASCSNRAIGAWCSSSAPRATALFLPLVFWFVPESVGWLCRRQPPAPWPWSIAVCARMGYGPVAALPVHFATRGRGSASVMDIFSPASWCA